MRNLRWSMAWLLAATIGLATAARESRALGLRSDDPAAGAQPKRETGVDRFLREHPEYDGRGVTVAIFDTGVDPGAPGLQTTSQGLPKIIDVVDGTGSGDVDTSTIREAEDGAIEGLTGRKLTIPSAWKNSSGDWHVGIKAAFEIFPGQLVGRMKEERRKDWDAAQRALLTSLNRKLTAFDAEHPKPTTEVLKTRDDIKARIAAAEALQGGYDDPGPIFDCVVWNDGEKWRAVIDTDEDGDLADEKVLTNFRDEREFGTFSDEDLMNYVLNIYEDGNLLSIVADSGAHGTHVAGIVAAYFPDQPELNGIAPGAQIVSVKIGDTRLGSTSVNTGSIRGMITVLENDCDLINMSYGGSNADPDDGRVTDLYNELVDKYGVIFVCSAGNSGPALTTVGAPGGATTSLFGIGAAISPEMMERQYSLRDSTHDTQYTWSSRGPTLDGDLGVKFSAPGGAISPVPNWVLQRNMLMNGTSMASPNCCGGIALMLSGLKAENVAYSPARVQRALENTARDVAEVEIFAEGRGMVQIDRAFDYLKKFSPYTTMDLRFDIDIPARDHARGVYLREPFETDEPQDIRVMVTPQFHEDADNREKVDFELRIDLESTARWVEVADTLMLMHGGRRLDIRVDPSRLDAGLHYAEIRGYDAAQPRRGPLFRVPITVIKPEETDESGDFLTEGAFEPGQVNRSFVTVPEGATWADFHIRLNDAETPKLFLAHCVQLVPTRSFSETEWKQYITLSPGEREVRSFPVVGGRTLEICLAQYWSQLGDTEVEYGVQFRGVAPSSAHLVIDGGELATRVDLAAAHGDTTVAPSASADTLRHVVRPSDREIRPLDGVRDRLPDERQIYEMVLTYNFNAPDDLALTPHLALSLLDEVWNTWESQIWMIFDANKKVIAQGTAEPRPVKLAEGDYTLKFHLRSTDLAGLEELEALPLLLDWSLGKPVSLKAYADIDDAVARSGSFGSRGLAAGEQVAVWIGSPDDDDLPKFAESGDRLLGEIRYAKTDQNQLGAGSRPGGYPLTVIVAAKASKPDEPKASDAEKDERSDAEKLADAIRDAKVAELKKLKGEDQKALFDKLADEILRDNPDYLPVHVARLHFVDDDSTHMDHLRDVIAAADAVIDQIDADALAQYFGREHELDDPAAKKRDKEMNERKDALVDALYRQGRALAWLNDDEEVAAPEAEHEALRAQLDETFTALQSWVDTTGKDYVRLHIRHEMIHDRLGEALQLLNAHLDDLGAEAPKNIVDKRRKLFERLGWDHWADYEARWQLRNYPVDYPRF